MFDSFFSGDGFISIFFLLFIVARPNGTGTISLPG